MTAAEFFGGRDVIGRTYPAYHPMRELLVTDSASYSTTNQSFQVVYEANEIQWLENAKKHIERVGKPNSMKVNDLSGYNSVLGEMRAFADLLKMSEFTVSSLGTGAKGPDFLLTKKDDGAKVYVEVFAYPPRPDNEEVIDEGRKEYFRDKNGGLNSIQARISVQDPFGFPKPGKAGESTTANAVSKICAIKFSEYQLDANSVSILYFDTQSLSFSYTMLEQCSPVLELNDTFTSGAIWLAYYGRKGFPILQNASDGYVLPENCVPMQHDGHFNQKSGSKLNAVIIGVANDPHQEGSKRLALLENSERPLPDSVRMALINSGCFDEQQSRCGLLVDLKKKLLADQERLFDAFNRFKSMHKECSFTDGYYLPTGG